MADITVDFHRSLGNIRPMHAVGQPPFGAGIRKLDFSPMQLLKEANIPYSRLHDVGGPRREPHGRSTNGHDERRWLNRSPSKRRKNAHPHGCRQHLLYARHK